MLAQVKAFISPNCLCLALLLFECVCSCSGSGSFGIAESQQGAVWLVGKENTSNLLKNDNFWEWHKKTLGSLQGMGQPSLLYG